MKMFEQYKGLRKELYVLFIGKVMTCMGSMVYPMLTLILSKKLGMSAGDIATYFLLFTLVGFPFNVIGGKLADKFNKRNIIVICDLISVVAYVFCFFREINLTTIIIFSVAGLFQNIEYPAYDALIADFTLPKDRERAYSLEYLGTNLGLVLAPTIGGLLFNNYLSYAFLINACSILLSTILIFFNIKDVHKEVDSEAKNDYEKEIDNKVSGFGYILKNRVVLLYLLMMIFNSAVYSMFSFLMPLDMGVVHGDNGAVLFGTMNSINCAVVIIFTAAITRICSKVFESRKMLIGEFLEISGYLIFMFFIKNIFLCYVCMVLFTFGEIFCTLACTPYLTKRIPSSHRGRIISIVNVTGNICSMLLSKFIGQVHDVSGRLTSWWVVIAFGVIDLLLIIVMTYCDKKDYKGLYE